MTVDELLVYGKQYIHKDLSKLLLSDMINKNALELLNYLDLEVNNEISEKYKRAVEAIRNNKPIQYVLNKVNFYGLELYVDERCLIPRFETEELVEKTLEVINNNFDKVSIVDLGCGSGAIGLTIKNKLPSSEVDLIDISEDALEVSKINKDKHKLDVAIIHNDMLKNINKKYDVIISNPPYIKENEEIEDIVKNNEPHNALYAGLDGLKFYEEILEDIKDNIKEKYLITFEIGSDQKEDLEVLATKYLPDSKYKCYKDMQGRDRIFLIASKDVNI